MKTKIAALSFVVVVLLLVSCNIEPNEKHILPAGFKGIVVIVYGQKDGKETVMENGTIVYNIPANGVLKTKQPTFGSNVGKFYYTGTPMKELPIIFFFDKKEIPRDRVCVFGISSGSYSKKSDVNTNFVKYLVGTGAEADSLLRASDGMGFLP